jgi:hypothetical protein
MLDGRQRQRAAVAQNHPAHHFCLAVGAEGRCRPAQAFDLDEFGYHGRAVDQQPVHLGIDRIDPTPDRPQRVRRRRDVHLSLVVAQRAGRLLDAPPAERKERGGPRQARGSGGFWQTKR